MRSVTSLAADGYKHSADEGYYNLIHVHPLKEKTARSVYWLMKEQSGIFKRQMSIGGPVRILSEANWAGKAVAPKSEDMSLQGNWRLSPDKIMVGRKEISIYHSSLTHNKHNIL